MTIKEDLLQHQLKRAIESTDLEELKLLHRSQYMNVRRAVAKNKSIDSEIANNLAHDPVLNVCYIASQNPKCTEKREFSKDIITVCVTCEKSEIELACESCEKLTNSSLHF
ncbi:hypothetical protein [Halarcobacter ebronensis]|uniref:Uncharacterized protein n=1 Tax=Halarcobacter ebronensis TaxID=1462615 RepID=A0A4Q1ART1_9BACT|nr:hypothetical protein [Halarcobacter ebronensis]QKF80537.1 hypothetical protein AEBR_0018 [Halarcobacter ebronensis]RXK08344.1 hypothetical protein CRV07_00635 [Halarcobacter ebronensis]